MNTLFPNQSVDSAQLIGQAMKAVRVLYLVTEDWGFLKHRIMLAREAQRIGCEVHVASAQGAHGEEIRRQGFVYHPVRLSRRSLNPFGDAATFVDLVRLYRTVRPDIVHHVALRPIVWGTAAARVVGVPGVVNAVTGLGYVFIGDGAGRRALRLVSQGLFAASLRGRRVRTIFQNPDDRAFFVSRRLADEARCRIIRGSGVDVRRFAPSPLPAGPPVVLVATRLLWDKGIGELVEASRMLRARGVECRVRLAGRIDPGNPACIPEQQVRAWHDEGLIEWIGNRDDMPEQHARSSVSCLPSYREGLPLALLEGAACGRPVVTTDVPGCREVVAPGTSGLLVPVRDAGALAGALETLVTDRQLASRMGAVGREMVEAEFSVETMARRTFEVYESLLGRPLGRA